MNPGNFPSIATLFFNLITFIGSIYACYEGYKRLNKHLLSLKPNNLVRVLYALILIVVFQGLIIVAWQ